MRIDLPYCGFKNCRHCFDGNCTKPSDQWKCEYWYLLHEESESAGPDLQPTCNQLATDTISRQDAIDAVNKIAPVNTEYDCTLLDILDVRYVLTELPSAEPERKKGKWINKEFYGIGEGSAECSTCHKRSSGYKEDDGWGVHCLFYDFCPNCGADMRGEEE